MRVITTLGLLVLPASLPAADKATCDAKPFTLKKPAPPPAAAPPSKPVVIAPKAAPVPPPKPKPKIVIGCKHLPPKA